MGNMLFGSDSSSENSPNKDRNVQQQNAPRVPPDRPPPPLSRQHSRADSTDSMLDSIDKELTDWKNSVRTLKGSNSPEKRQQLIKMASETEKSIRRFNRKMKKEKHQKGNSTFYIPCDADEDFLLTVLNENDNLQHENEKLTAELDAGNQTTHKLKRHITNIEALLKAEKKQTEQLEEENASLLLRLSKVAGDRLVENNPAIADLNDRNRPTKLGEIYSEIYDNEWTDAFESLQAEEYNEEFAIETLHLTLVNVFDFCKQKSESMLRKTEDSVNFLFEEYKILQDTEEVPHHMTMSGKRTVLCIALFKVTCQQSCKKEHSAILANLSKVLRVSSIKLPSNLQNDIQLQQRWKLKPETSVKAAGTLKIEKSDIVSTHVKLLQKGVAESMVPVVQKAYMKASWIDGEFVPALKPFIRKCIFLCWMMVVQSPQMSFNMVEVDKEVAFDKNMYKEYTSSGKMIKFVVWPALLLYDNGPMVGKGVAQGCKSS